MTTLAKLQEWYKHQCNAEWEHTYGVKIETSDNPGWSVEIDLTDTSLDNKPFDEIHSLESDFNWIKCWVENKKFRGVGGPEKLEEIFRVFINWTKKPDGMV